MRPNKTHRIGAISWEFLVWLIIALAVLGLLIYISVTSGGLISEQAGTL